MHLNRWQVFPIYATWRIYMLSLLKHSYYYEGWNFNSGNYLFTTDTKKNICFEVLLSFNVVTSIVYNPLPAMWKS